MFGENDKLRACVDVESSIGTGFFAFAELKRLKNIFAFADILSTIAKWSGIIKIGVSRCFLKIARWINGYQLQQIVEATD